MPSVQVTLALGAITPIPIDAPTGRVVVTQMAGTPAEVYITADTSTPIVPIGGVEVAGNQSTLFALIGAQVTVQPPLTAGHMSKPTIQLLSAGTPTVLVQW